MVLEIFGFETLHFLFSSVAAPDSIDFDPGVRLASPDVRWKALEKLRSEPFRGVENSSPFLRYGGLKFAEHFDRF